MAATAAAWSAASPAGGSVSASATPGWWRAAAKRSSTATSSRLVQRRSSSATRVAAVAVGVPSDQGFGGVGSPTGVGGLLFPVVVEAAVLDFGFATPGGQDSLLASVGRVRGAGGRQPVVDLLGALREPVEQQLG